MQTDLVVGLYLTKDPCVGKEMKDFSIETLILL
jgi:hypothetical protein